MPSRLAIGVVKPRNDECNCGENSRSILAKLDLVGRYRTVVQLLRYLEDDIPGLTARVPAECPYSLDQVIGKGDEDWFPEPRLPMP